MTQIEIFLGLVVIVLMLFIFIQYLQHKEMQRMLAWYRNQLNEKYDEERIIWEDFLKKMEEGIEEIDKEIDANIPSI